MNLDEMDFQAQHHNNIKLLIVTLPFYKSLQLISSAAPSVGPKQKGADGGWHWQNAVPAFRTTCEATGQIIESHFQ